MTKTKTLMDECPNWQCLLVRGNTVAKTHARRILGKRKLGRFLKVLRNPASAPALKVSSEQVEQILNLPPVDKEVIQLSQEIAQKVCLQFERMAIRIARKYATGTGHDSEADILQLESEAKVGLLKAIRGYSSLQTKFITYAYRSCANEVSRYLQRSMGTTLSGANQTLLVRYGRMRDSLALAGKPCSLEDVCRELELSRGQIARLKRSLASQVGYEGDMEDTLAQIVTDQRKNTLVDKELIARMEAVSMTWLERSAFQSQSEEIRSLFFGFPGCHKNLKAVAAHFGVTPQAASEALKRARRKLAAALQDYRPGK